MSLGGAARPYVERPASQIIERLPFTSPSYAGQSRYDASITSLRSASPRKRIRFCRELMATSSGASDRPLYATRKSRQYPPGLEAH